MVFLFRLQNICKQRVIVEGLPVTMSETGPEVSENELLAANAVDQLLNENQELRVKLANVKEELERVRVEHQFRHDQISRHPSVLLKLMVDFQDWFSFEDCISKINTRSLRQLFTNITQMKSLTKKCLSRRLQDDKASA